MGEEVAASNIRWMLRFRRASGEKGAIGTGEEVLDANNRCRFICRTVL